MNKRQASRLQALSFALVETTLYLDVHPECKRALAYYNKVRAEYEKEREAYEAENGPLTSLSTSASENGTWQWTDSPWPWENDIRK